MKKNEAKKLIDEFEKVHSEYSASRAGHWGKNWKEKLKYADLKNGYWYWRGYCIKELKNIL